MLFRIALPALALIAGIHGAQAQNLAASDPAAIAATITQMGYRSEMQADPQGNPKIASSAEGVNFSIYFYGCSGEHDKCTSIQFRAGFDKKDPLDQSVATEWNETKRFAKARLTSNGDPILRFDVNLDKDGVTKSNFTDTFRIWTLLLSQFKTHIKWN